MFTLKLKYTDNSLSSESSITFKLLPLGAELKPWTELSYLKIPQGYTMYDKSYNTGVIVNKSKFLFFCGAVSKPNFSGWNYYSDAIAISIDEINDNQRYHNILSSLVGCTSISAEVYNNSYVYLIGGFDGSSNLNIIQLGKLNDDGEITKWNKLQLPQYLSSQGSIIYNDKLYIIGGLRQNKTIDNNGQYVYKRSYTNSVYVTDIYSDGSIGAWQSTSELNEVKGKFGIVSNRNYIYVLGGEYVSGTTACQYQTVEYAKINSDGTLDQWKMTSPLMIKTDSCAAFIYNNYVYVVGGYCCSKIQYAAIHEDGSLGPFNYCSVNTPYYSYQPNVFVVDGDIYYIDYQNHIYKTTFTDI